MNQERDWMTVIKRLIDSVDEESGTVEFKQNNGDPEMIGKDISALANMAALLDAERAYMIWGVSDDKELTGTSFTPKKKVGNENLENWLMTQLEPRLFISFHEATEDGKRYVILEIEKSREFSTSFKKIAYCRIKNYTKPLRDFPVIEKKLWQKLSDLLPEERIVLSNLNLSEAASLLSFESYFKALGSPLPSSLEEMARRLGNDGFLKEQGDGCFSITTMGALLLANDLSAFPTLGRKQITITLFEGDSKIQNRESREFSKGYLLSFEEAVAYLKTLSLMRTRVNSDGYTVSSYAYPDIVLREGLTNCIIHQNLLERGAGPMVNVTNSFIEFANPGTLRINPDHIIDAEPIAENEKMSSFLRRVGIGDARGTGFDKIEYSLEERHMRSPMIRELSNSVSTFVYAPKPFDEWNLEEKLLGAYYHACLLYYSTMGSMNNETLRERFGLSAKDKSTVSRLIRALLERGKIKAINPGSADKNRAYVPYWA